MKPIAALGCLLFVAALESPFCLSAQETAAPTGQVAVVNGTPITEDDLDIEAELIQLEQQAYQLRLGALEQAIEKRLLDQEASKQGVSVDELLRQNVESKISDPSPEQVDAFYEQQKSRINRPLEEVRTQLGEIMKQMQQQEFRRAFVTKLREAGEVSVLLEAPRMAVEIEGAPRRGPENAPVTIVEFSDFQCPFCKRAQPTLRQVQEKYPEQIAFVYKDLPLRDIHPEAQRAGEAAHCAGDQNKYWEFHQALFASEQLTEELYSKIGDSLQLDAAAFQQCLDSGKHAATVNANYEQALSVGANSTPTFFVNGILLRGAVPLENFTKIIDAELARTAEP